MIEIGFTEDENYWKSSKEKDDVRPYGNFVVDKETNMLYAFTMRDNTHTTRYFAFELPKVYEGAKDEKYGVKKVVLNTCDIIDYFDCDYHHYVQGACINQGKIYSLEGFTNSEENPPVLRIIDVKEKKEILFFEFKKLDINVEPEMIDFYKGVCYYGDHNGNLYKIDFEN